MLWGRWHNEYGEKAKTQPGTQQQTSLQNSQVPDIGGQVSNGSTQLVTSTWANTASRGFGGIALGYATNFAQNATSQVGVQQRPTTGTSTISYRNSMLAFGPCIEVFVGYQWPLSTHWHVALGEAFWYAGFSHNSGLQASAPPTGIPP